MANKDNISIPAGFGGLMRFKEEYSSKLKFGPWVVIGMIIAVIVFVVVLNIVFG